MNKTMLVIAAGLVALTGVAMAEQAVVISGNLHTPAGDVPIQQSTSGLPVPGTSVPLGQTADDLNGGLEENGVPVRAVVNEEYVKADVRCSGIKDINVEGALDPACQDEPTLNWVDNDYVMVGPDGAAVKNFVSVQSGQAFTFVPEEVSSQVPEEQKAAIEDANEQVNAEAAAALVDDSALGANGARPRFFVGDDELLQSGRMKGLLAGLGFGPGSIGDGVEGLWTPEGWDEHFARDAPGLSGTGGDERADLAPAEAQGAPASGGDLAAMAAMAAIAGGAILAPLALYHRIRANHALNNKTRQMVYDAVVRTPGIGVNDAAKAANCSYSTAAYHLERLVEERLLIVSEDGRRARYFKNGGAFSQAEREFVPILQSKECMDVLQVIVENPWCYRAEVAQKLGVSGPTVNWHLKKLMNVGVVKEMREGRVSYLYADKKALGTLGGNLVGKLPEDLVARLRFEHRPATEFVEPAASLPETTVPEIGLGEYDGIELAPLPEASS